MIVAGAITSSVGGTQAIVSDKHDVIICRTYNGIGCSDPFQSVEQFAEKAGYKQIIKKGVAFNGSKEYIILEVTK